MLPENGDTGFAFAPVRRICVPACTAGRGERAIQKHLRTNFGKGASPVYPVGEGKHPFLMLNAACKGRVVCTNFSFLCFCGSTGACRIVFHRLFLLQRGGGRNAEVWCFQDRAAHGAALRAMPVDVPTHRHECCNPSSSKEGEFHPG